MSTPVKPLDPQSERGRELARELTVALDEIEEEIAARKSNESAGKRERAA
jgi:hypothetical protein